MIPEDIQSVQLLGIHLAHSCLVRIETRVIVFGTPPVNCNAHTRVLYGTSYYRAYDMVTMQLCSDFCTCTHFFLFFGFRVMLFKGQYAIFTRMSSIHSFVTKA
jgi:hypothetical protein